MKYVDTDEYPYVPRARERKTKHKSRKRRSLSVILREIQRMEGRLVYHSCDGAQVQTTQVGLHGMLKSAMRKYAPGIYLVQQDGLECGRITLVDEHFLKRMAVMLRDAYAHRTSIDLQQGDFDAWLRRGRRRHRFLEQVQQRLERPDLFVEGHACWLADDAQRPSEQPVEQVYNRLTALAAGRRHQPLAVGDPWVDWHQLGRTLDQWPFDLLAHLPVSRDQMPRLLMLCQKHELNTPEVAVVVEELLLIDQKIDVLDFLDHLTLLIEGVRRLPQELDRRLGLLAKAIFYALGEDRLYIRKPAAPILPNGCASYYLNSAVLENILTYFAREYPEMKVFHKEEPSWQRLFLRLFGVKVCKDWGTWEVVLPVDPQFDPLNFLLSQIKKKFPEPKEMVLGKWTGMLALQAARLAGLTGDSSAPMALSLWLDTCREACTPGKTGLDPLQLCIFTNKSAVDAIGADRASAAAYLRILNNESEHLRECLYHEIGELPQTLVNYQEELLAWKQPMFAVFANPLFHSRSLKELTDKACFLWLVWVDQKNSDRLKPFVDWMRPEYHTEHGLCSFWANIFVFLKPDVRAIFIALWRALADVEGATERQRGMVVEVFAMAAWKGEYSAELLRDHRPMLEHMARTLLASASELKKLSGKNYEARLNAWGHLFLSAIPSASLWLNHFPDRAENIGPRLVDYFNGWLLKGLKRGKTDVPGYPRWHAGYLMLVRLGGGGFSLFQCMVETSRKGEFTLPKIVDGWAVLQDHAGLQEFLVNALEQANLRKRVYALIEQLPRLEDRLGRRAMNELLHEFDHLPPPELPPVEPEVLRKPLAKLAAWREILGEDPIPASLMKVLKTRTIYEGEVRVLQSRDRSDHEEARLQKLQGWLADPESLAQRIEQEFFKRYVKAVRVDSLAAFEHVLQDRMQQHWRAMGFQSRGVDNEADWDHAMKFHGEIDSNQRIFRRLLRACAAGDPGWVQRHAVNQRFIAEMKARPTGKIVRWLQHFEIKQRIGASTWRVYTEEDPLQVLKMGTYFDTCLSWDGCNAHSAVANAVEINKRVLYVHNGKTIVGRRLLVLTRSGQLLGFYSYISESKAPEYVQILLDQLCLKMAEETGYALVKDVAPFDEADDPNKDIRLFADWYYDCGEDYDAWVHLGAHPRDMPLSELEQRVRAAKTGDDLETGWVRFLIAAGAKAGPLAEKLGQEQVLTTSQVETVVNHLKVIS